MSINEVSFEQAAAFNEQLIALQKMGIEFDLGFDHRENLATVLRQIESEIVLKSGRGDSSRSVDQVFSNVDVPYQYRSALQIWATCDDPTVVLDAISQPVQQRNRIGAELGRQLIYPVFVLLLTLAGFLLFQSFVYPRVEAIYAQLWERTEQSSVLTSALRGGTSIWGPALILSILFVCFLVWTSRKSLGRAWMPGSRRFLHWHHSARRTEQLASLSDAGMSIDEASNVVFSMRDRGDVATLASPLYNWAIANDDKDSVAQSHQLRLASKFYRYLAADYSQNWNAVIPMVIGVFVGGVAVLCYGYSLFQPMVDLLSFVSHAGATP